jgi:MFS family permease
VKNAVEALANLGPLIAGAIADAASLRVAFFVLVPVYVIGGAVALIGLRHYPTDLAYVVAHARAKRIAGEMPDQADEAEPG